MGITVLLTAVAFLIAAAPALAAPANDNFADAQVANTGDTNPTSGSNVDATKEAGEPNHAGDAGGASVWYRWTAPSSGAATVDTCDSSFDTLLGVYTGDSVSSLTPVGSSDDGCVSGMGGFVGFEAGRARSTGSPLMDSREKPVTLTSTWCHPSRPRPRRPRRHRRHRHRPHRPRRLRRLRRLRRRTRRPPVTTCSPGRPETT